MNDPAAAAPTGRQADRGSHETALFEGAASRRHVRLGMRRMRLSAILDGMRYRRHLADARDFVQFAGWPRSGHSLIGALVDAHPQAAVAHELDAMGLYHKGMPADRLPALACGNAARFTASGRHWNGYAYAVGGAPHGPSGPLKVVGDKKGDWATRWSALDPGLVGRLAQDSRLRPRWILVTRHPADNVATMSLRLGRDYDRIRIAGTGDMAAAIAAAQSDGRMAAEVDDGAIADYGALAAAVSAMKSAVPPGDWHEIVYEDFAAAPRDGLLDLAAFLGLDPDFAWLDGAAALVSPGRTPSRTRIAWRPDQRAAVAGIIADHDFLSGYEADV